MKAPPRCASDRRGVERCSGRGSRRLNLSSSMRRPFSSCRTDAERTLYVAAPGGSVPGADRADRSRRAVAAIGHRGQPGSRLDCRRPRYGACVERTARAAARRPGLDQGQHRHRRSDDDDRRLAGARRIDCAAGRVRRRTPARRRRGDSGQDEPERVGELPVDQVDERLERARRTSEESVRARSQSVRIELGHGHGDRREPRRHRRRHGNRWLDRLPVVGGRAGRDQADGWPGRPLRHHPDLPLAGHRGPDDTHRCRCRGAAHRDDRGGSQRRGDHTTRAARTADYLRR